MALELTITNQSGDQKFEFSHLDLPNFIVTLYNHQKKPKAERILTLEEADALIAGYEGSKQFRLDKVKNTHKHSRFMGLLIEGTWEGQTFTPTSIRINEDDFNMGGTSKKRKVVNKFKKNAKPLMEVIATLQSVNDAIRDVSISQSEAQNGKDRQSLSESLSAAQDDELDSQAVLASSVDEGPDVEAPQPPQDAPSLASEQSFVIQVSSAASSEDLSDIPPLTRADANWPISSLSSSSDDSAAEATPDVNMGARFAALEAARRAEADKDSAASEDKALKPKAVRGRNAPPNSPASARVRDMDFVVLNPTDEELSSGKVTRLSESGELPSVATPKAGRNWFKLLIWPTVNAALTFVGVRVLHAAKWLTMASVGTMSMTWAGIAFAVTGLYQLMREAHKSKSVEAMRADVAGLDDLQQKLAQMPDQEWAAFKHGFEANTAGAQLRSWFCKQDYNSAYYQGEGLHDQEPDFDLDRVEAMRPKSV